MESGTMTLQLTGSDTSQNRRPEKARRRGSSSSQTAKKRELDRIAQKKSRERARNRMKELEEKLNRLQDDDKQKQISDLLRTVDELRKENERLRSVTQRIRSLTDAAGPRLRATGKSSLSRRSSTPTPFQYQKGEQYGEEISREQDSTVSADWWNSKPATESPSTELSPDPIDFENMCSPGSRYDESIEICSPAVSEISPSFDFGPFSRLADFDTALSWGTPGQIRLSKSERVVPDVDKWRVSNEAFVFGIDIGKKTVESHVIDSLAAYKAILWGCNEVEEKERAHPLWLALRQVDEKVFGMWQSKAQKIAMMFVCHRMLLYRANPCPETLSRVPAFLRPRPSQETIQHPAVIDFLIWPGLRDRLVFSHPRYTSSGAFSAAFCTHLHFHFPFPDSEILSFDAATHTHRISPLFEEYAFELGNWTMGEGFFEQFGEMRGDVLSRRGRMDWRGLFEGMPMTA